MTFLMVKNQNRKPQSKKSKNRPEKEVG